MAIASEAGELLAALRWIHSDASDEFVTDPANRLRVEQEVADVAIALLLFCDRAEIDLLGVIERKIDLNETNYPLNLQEAVRNARLRILDAARSGVVNRMIYRSLADAVVVLHLCFVAFVILGGFLLRRWPKLIYVHIPVAVWGVLIEFAGWICPLTPLENSLRARGGQAGYEGDFIAHYLIPVLYPYGLTRNIQFVLGALAFGVNLLAYFLFFRQRSHQKV